MISDNVVIAGYVIAILLCCISIGASIINAIMRKRAAEWWKPRKHK